MRRQLACIFILLIPEILLAQGAYDKLSSSSKKARELYIQGDYFFVRNDYATAITWFDKATKKDKNFVEAYFRKGTSYFKMFDTLGARTNWEKAAQVANNDIKHSYLYYYLGKLYYDTGEYQKSLDASKAYFSLNPVDPKFTSRVAHIKVLGEFAVASMEENLQYNPKPLKEELNKFPMQYFPALPADMQSIIFTRRTGFEPTDDEDIYISFREGQKWSTPHSLSDNINTHGNEGTCAVSGDGRTLIFTSCLGREGYGSCDLFVSIKEGENWSEPQNMGPMINSGGWDSQPSLSADGRTLYFISDRQGGYGKRDIWKSHKRGGEWTKAQNVGNTINTRADEVSPFIHVSGERLYFASDGHIGMGGFDLYYSDKATDSWTDPINMGYSLNTKNDQVSLVIAPDGQHGYYSLDIASSYGRSRSLLYKIDIPEKHQLKFKSSYVRGVVFDAKTKAPLEASVELKDLRNERSMLQVTSDKVNGEYLMVLTEGATYGLFVTREGYVYKSLTFEFEGINTNVEIDVYLDPIEKGATVVMNNIFFETDSDVLSTTSKAEIDEVADFLRMNPATRIRIEGHTDDTGTAAYNLGLSNRRAEAVKDQLIDLGIAAERVDARGLGMTIPIADNDSALGKATNRRIEFRIID